MKEDGGSSSGNQKENKQKGQIKKKKRGGKGRLKDSYHGKDLVGKY